MNKNWPVNLDIRTIQPPPILTQEFIFLGLILYMLSKSVESERVLMEAKEIFFLHPFGKVSFLICGILFILFTSSS